MCRSQDLFFPIVCLLLETPIDLLARSVSADQLVDSFVGFFLFSAWAHKQDLSVPHKICAENVHVRVIETVLTGRRESTSPACMGLERIHQLPYHNQISL